jgi:hypothetical protein
MAFTQNTLQKVGGGLGGANTLYIYSTEDADTVVRVADYFLSAIDQLEKNDVIISVCNTDGTSVVKIMYVVSKTATAIDVTDGTTVAATDND